jgi:hypothetical protein
MNSIRVQNLPKTIDIFEHLKSYIIECEEVFGPVLYIRVHRECKKGAKDGKDMVVFIRLLKSEKHVQLLSCLDGEHLQGIQVKATNSNFTTIHTIMTLDSETTYTGWNMYNIQSGQTTYGHGQVRSMAPTSSATKARGVTI